MTPKLWNIVLVAGGLMMVLAGVQQWRINQRPRETTRLFLEAVRDNDRATAFQLMTPKMRERAETADERLEGVWENEAEPSGEHSSLTFEILSVHARGADAKVTAQFRQGAMPFVNSTIKLRRQDDGMWKVSQMENRVSLAWQMLQNQQVAEELREALKDLPKTQAAKERSAELQ